MIELQNLTVEQLRKVVSIKEQIEMLQGEIEAITDSAGAAVPESPKAQGRKKMSPSERARVAVAARWAKARAAKASGAPKKKRKMSAAGRAKIAAAAKARWAKFRAERKKGKRASARTHSFHLTDGSWVDLPDILPFGPLMVGKV